MTWFTALLVVAVLASEGSLAVWFPKHGFRFQHEKQELDFLRHHLVKKVENVAHMDQGHILTTNWHNCGSGSATGQVVNLTITPNPIRVPGDIHVAVGAVVRENLEAPIRGDLLIKKKLFGQWIRIPCIDKKIGSCTYDDVCEMIPMKPGKPCPDPLPKYSIPCHCPFNKGNYYLPESTFKLKKPGKSVPSWLESGDYQITIHLSSKGREAGCIYLEFTLKL
ncbi:ganglioside GM2 activator-like [Lineus longissimus]|uniref:ganglioside GM2 activator-like n=1 Tax=Lineus longissimus TaxID=88925 RepID=UPI002B4CAC9B